MMTPDYLLGLRLATASDDVLLDALSERPCTLALLRHLNEVIHSSTRTGGLDALLNPVRERNPNERRLSRITAPPATAGSRRRVTRIRLRRMQEELIAGKFPGSYPAGEQCGRR
jgi:hypothetical protein